MDSEHTIDATGPPSPFNGGGTESGNDQGHGGSSVDWEHAGAASRSDMGYPDELSGKKGAAGGGGKSSELELRRSHKGGAGQRAARSQAQAASR